MLHRFPARWLRRAGPSLSRRYCGASVRKQGSLPVEIHRTELDVAQKMPARCVRLAVLKSQCGVLPGTRWSAQQGFAIVCSRLTLSSGATIPGQRQPMWKGMVLMKKDLVRLVGFVPGHEMFQIQCFRGRIVTQVTLLNPSVVWRARLRDWQRNKSPRASHSSGSVADFHHT